MPPDRRYRDIFPMPRFLTGLSLTCRALLCAAMVQLGSIGGALFAFLVADRIGRIWATRVLCTLWMVGIAIFMANRGSLGLVYAGRFIAGLVSTYLPTYLLHLISPSSVMIDIKWICYL